MFADMCMNVSLCLACVFYASHTQRLITKLRQEDITGEILKCDDSVECSGVGVGCFSLQTICSSSRWEQIKPVLTFKSKTSSQLTRTKDNTASKKKHKNNNNKNNKINNNFYFYYNKSFEASGVSAG